MDPGEAVANFVAITGADEVGAGRAVVISSAPTTVTVTVLLAPVMFAPMMRRRAVWPVHFRQCAAAPRCCEPAGCVAMLGRGVSANPLAAACWSFHAASTRLCKRLPWPCREQQGTIYVLGHLPQPLFAHVLACRPLPWQCWKPQGTISRRR